MHCLICLFVHVAFSTVSWFGSVIDAFSTFQTLRRSFVVVCD